MPRIRQYFPQNYVSSSYIHTEFENIIRYLNSAELGNKTIGELMSSIFDEDGNFAGPIEFQIDTDIGLQYRIGEFRVDDEGWITIASMDELRGPPGENIGTIEGPLFYNRQDIIVSGTPDTVTYSLVDLEAESIVVYRNGLLLAEADYSLDPSTGIITFDYNLTNADRITIYSIRAKVVGNYRRMDYEAVTTQSTVAFDSTPEDTLLVYRNGMLQRLGGGYDYTVDPNQDTITFFTPLDPGDLVTVVVADNTSVKNVGGIMLEDQYTDNNGFILYNKLTVSDGEIPQAKVSNLTSALSGKANQFIGSSTPVSANTGDLWLDTSQTPNLLKFYDGVTWLLTSPTSTLPTFNLGNANQYIRVNGTGTALEYGVVDMSSLVPKTYMGAANGVATLDSSGKLPTNQLPNVYSVSSIPFYTQWQTSSTTTANATYFVSYVYKQILRIDGIALKLSAGTCDVRISEDGTPVGATYNATSTLQNISIGSSIQIDGTSVGRRLEIAVTNQSSAGILEGCLTGATLSV